MNFILFKGKSTKSRETVSSDDDAASSTAKEPRLLLTDYFKSSGNAEMSTGTRDDVDSASGPADDKSSVLPESGVDGARM
jgi:hypothetical protein